jgi:hypothetical protein
LVADPVAERARLLDVDVTLVWAGAQCSPPFRVLPGHSMGAESVMLEAGARDESLPGGPEARQVPRRELPGTVPNASG